LLFLPIPLYVGQLIARARLVTDVGRHNAAICCSHFRAVLDLWALAWLYAVLAVPIPDCRRRDPSTGRAAGP
jgi:hypothetical protein